MTTGCQVCGYDMEFDPLKSGVCLCCGSDVSISPARDVIEFLRNAWILSGMRWWCQLYGPPPGWNAEEQLKELEECEQCGG